MSALRRASFLCRLGWAGVRGRPARTALVGLGIAASAAVLATVLAGSLLARDGGVSHAVESLPASSRAVRAVSYGTPSQVAQSYGTLDRAVRGALRPIVDRGPVGLVLYRESTIAGSFISLGAVDGLADWVELSSGRLPEPCRPERCEVLHLQGEGRIPSVPGLRLIVVGEARLRSSILFGDFLAPEQSQGDEAELSPVYQEAEQWHRAPPPPLLLADGVAGLSASPQLEQVYRSFAWVVPLADGAVRVWDVGRFEGAVVRARSELQALSGSFDVLAPVEELQRARETTEVGGRRLLLVGGEAAALLLAFAVLAAATLRRDVEAARNRLTWFGARRWQLEALVAGEAAVLAAVATAAGWAIGVGVCAALAAQDGAPVAEVIRHSVLSGGGIAAAALLAAGAAIVLVTALRARSVALRGFSVSPIDLLALGALAVILVGVARGDVSSRALAEESGTGWYLLLLPGLVAFVLAVLAARLVGPAARLLERLGRGAVAVRLAALSVARSPGRAAIAVAFFAVSVGLALFAASYRSTLAEGQAQQAAYAVPLDFVVREDLAQLVPVVEAAPDTSWRELGRSAVVDPIVRVTGTVSRLGTTGVTALGLDPSTIPALGGWRSDFSSTSRSELAGRILPAEPVELRGLDLPADATGLALPVRGSGIAVAVTVRLPAGRFATVELGKAVGDGPETLRASLPPGAGGGRVVGLALRPPRRLAGDAGSGGGRALEGAIRLGGLVAETSGDAEELTADYAGWIGDGGIQVDHANSGVVLEYSLTNELVSRFRPRQATDGQPIPAIVSPRLAAAAADGLLPVRLAGQQLVVRVVATARRFPGVPGRFANPGGDFLIADRTLLATALDTGRPGTGTVNELWIGDGPGATSTTIGRALERPPFEVLQVISRAQVEHDLQDDPLARAVLWTLLAAAAIALGLGLVGLVLVLLGDLRDDAGQLFDLEAQGAPPSALRRVVRLRSGGVVVAGLLWGLVGGVALAALVVDLVSVTADSTQGEPPLRLAISWEVVGPALAVYALVLAAVVLAATRGAFRSARGPARLPDVGA